MNTPVTLGILAHVDAGKTTLTEAMLYGSGALRQIGRVDHGDAFLDFNPQERERGITIFSKQARFSYGGRDITLIDTPGHSDFSGEAERVLQILPCAVLVISASDGIKGNTALLWDLLDCYRVPTFLFINKMDQPGNSRDRLLPLLRSRLSSGCLDFSQADFLEEAASESEGAMEEYLSTGSLSEATLRSLIARRKIFPCFFGSALNNTGVSELLDGLVRFFPQREYPEAFSARVYKISRDGNHRLTWLKVAGGTLRAKDVLTYTRGGTEIREKADQLRLYSGEKFTVAQEVPAGGVCAVTGLSATRIGDCFGAPPDSPPLRVRPVFSSRVTCPGTDPPVLLQKLRLLEEEEPLLGLSYSGETGEITLQLMGEIQQEILQKEILGRFGLQVFFEEGRVLYRETITKSVEGVGHYEPLRHYAEVHLLLEPGERGSGLRFSSSSCTTDELDLNWQRLVLTHLEEKVHRGVLIGAPVTDLRITLAAGRAHLKHTEGGDFRQATYRAVRQGLMGSESLLLEPWYNLTLVLPAGSAGRAMADLERMGATFAISDNTGDEITIRGAAPVSEIRDYRRELLSYTRGQGSLALSFRDYEPCHNAAEVIAAAAYVPERDTANPADSVFCSRGAGTVVPWNEVPRHMHLKSIFSREPAPAPAAPALPAEKRAPAPGGTAMDRELLKIFERTYGPVKERLLRPRSEGGRRAASPSPAPKRPSSQPPLPGPEYLLVDGYNILHAWPELKEIALDNLDAARGLLTDILCSYRAYRENILILVFDAYRVPYHKEEVLTLQPGMYVVYTKTAETADAYIEKTAHTIAGKHPVRVATSDNLEQLIIFGQGALRVPASAFREEVLSTLREISAFLDK